MSPQYGSLSDGMTGAGISYEDLWLRHIAIGGDVSVLELEAYVHGALAPTEHVYDLIAHTLNEYFLDAELPDHVSYTNERRRSDTESGTPPDGADDAR